MRMILYFAAAVLAVFLQSGQAPGGPKPAANSTQEKSLGEQAQEYRNDARSVHLTPEQRGKVLNGKYTNDFFQFEIVPPPQWELYSAGRMNVSEAIGRDRLHLEAGLKGAGSRLFGMGDGGANTVVGAAPLQPDSLRTPELLAANLKRIILPKVPSPKELPEPVLLGDATHHFAAFRYSYLMNGTPIVQSVEVTVINGFVLTFSTTTSTEQDMSTALRSIQSRLVWKSAIQ
jgi:hypothetical protein